MPALLPPSPELAFRDSNPHVHEHQPRWGVNVAGFFTAELGVGEAARLLIAGLDAAGIPALPDPGQPRSPRVARKQAFSYAAARRGCLPDQHRVHQRGRRPGVRARSGPLVLREPLHDRAVVVGGRRATGRVGAWRMSLIDEVWVRLPAHLRRDRADLAGPVVRMTLPVMAPEVAARTRAELGLPEDGLPVPIPARLPLRRGAQEPAGFDRGVPTRLLAPGDGAKLVLKSINAETCPQEHERIELAAVATRISR